MRFYDRQHRYYAGIDLHARTMHLCVLDSAGCVVWDVNLATLTGRHGARKSFLGARRKARSRQAGANGQVASTLKGCLVQPGG